MTTRRGFLAGILAAAAAPAIVRAELLMPIKKIWVPPADPFGEILYNAMGNVNLGWEPEYILIKNSDMVWIKQRL